MPTGGISGFEVLASPLLGEQGQVSGGLINARDISARKHDEEELRAREQTLRAISDTAHDAVIMMNSAAQVGHWNAAAERMFGYTKEEILGRNLHQLLAPKHYRDRSEEALPHFFRTGQGAALGKMVELEALRKDGSRFSIELTVAGVLLRGEWRRCRHRSRHHRSQASGADTQGE